MTHCKARGKTYVKGPDTMSKSVRTQERYRKANRGQTTLGAFAFTSTPKHANTKQSRPSEVTPEETSEGLLQIRQESIEVEIPPDPLNTRGVVNVREESVEVRIPPSNWDPVPDDEAGGEEWEGAVDEYIQGGNEIRSWTELREQIKADLRAKKTLPVAETNQLLIIRNFATLQLKGFGRIAASNEIARQWHESEGVHFARKVRELARHYQVFEQLPKRKPSGNKSSHSLLLDEQVRTAVRTWLLAQTAGSVTPRVFQHALNESIFPSLSVTLKRPLCERTARRWLRKLGWRLTTLRKGVYMDGHEREDVVKYRQEVFLPAMAKFEERMRKFEGPEMRPVSPTLKDGEKEIVPNFHDESCFHMNEYKTSAW